MYLPAFRFRVIVDPVTYVLVLLVLLDRPSVIFCYTWVSPLVLPLSPTSPAPTHAASAIQIPYTDMCAPQFVESAHAIANLAAGLLLGIPPSARPAIRYSNHGSNAPLHYHPPTVTALVRISRSHVHWRGYTTRRRATN